MMDVAISFPLVNINQSSINKQAKKYKEFIKTDYCIEDINNLIKYIDLTLLTNDGCQSDVQKLYWNALNFSQSETNPINCASICISSNKIDAVNKLLKESSIVSSIKLACVSGNFPSGQAVLKIKLSEIEHIVLNYKDDVDEIDTVIDRSLIIAENWEGLYEEISLIRQRSVGKVLKTILSVGEINSYDNIFKAAYVAIIAGSDFIKTSTGKEVINSNFESSLIMIRAIKEYHYLTSKKIGFKAAGGIKTVKEALCWINFIKSELGDEWLNPKIFRIGASSLIDSVREELQIFKRNLLIYNA